MRPHLYKSVLAAFLSVCAPAVAAQAPAPLHFIGRYDFAWNGIPLGAVILSVQETQTGYTERLQVKSLGVVNLFTRHMSLTDASGIRTSGGYLPQHYESDYKTKNKPRHIKLTFDARGVITEEVVQPPEDRKERPEAPHTLKDGSYDPLSGLLMLRRGFETVRMFDAKRLYEVKATPGPQDKSSSFLSGKYTGTYIILSRKPLAGLTAKEQADYDKGEPPLSLYFSTDATHIPLGVSLHYLGSLSGTLAKECTTWDECAP